jgi:membrane associated rhomboid family serine protease
MIPLKTLPDATRKPFWTRVFALAIALVWLVQLWVVAFRGHNLALEWGVRPVCFLHPSGCGIAATSPLAFDFDSWPAWVGSPLIRLVVSPFTALWLHANWLHVAFNLLFLLVFGGAVEGDIGHARFARLYLGGGLVATLCHIAFNGGSSVTTVGASGAIAAVLGAHCWRLPRAWVLTYFPPVFLLPVPAPLFGILWLALQMVGAWHDFHSPLSALSSGASVAWTAHVGGFAWGAWVGYRSPASYDGPVQLKHKFNRP